MAGNACVISTPCQTVPQRPAQSSSSHQMENGSFSAPFLKKSRLGPGFRQRRQPLRSRGRCGSHPETQRFLNSPGPVTVAIDGAGAGKSTVARMLAARLGFRYLDTGAMYRALTWLAIKRGLPLGDEDALGDARAREPGHVRRRPGASSSPAPTSPRDPARAGRPDGAGRRAAPAGARGDARAASASSATRATS